MKIYFIRHGESSANVQQIFSNSGNKHPLTQRGIEQAQRLASELVNCGITRIFSSPILRARQTAEILAGSLQENVEITEALREWSVGILEGTSDPQGWALHRQVQEDWYFHANLDSKIPEGESFNEITRRFQPFVRGLIAGGEEADGNIALVSHGGLYLAMLPRVLTNVSIDFALEHLMPNASFILAEPGPDGLRCLEWCGVPLIR
jgi:2,3-bisphosphoglycerate-dependent phosphoglycerate mutase